jgi:hypothetical protein
VAQRALRMRQSLAQFEAAFHEETAEDRARREAQRVQVINRSVSRRRERAVRHGTMRFVVLIVAMLGTTVLVTVLMFRMLALWFS